MTQKRFRSNRKGMTLVELIVSISIFGLVMAIATPAIVRFLRRSQAKDAAGIVMGVMRNARARAIHEKNNYIVIFDVAGRQMFLLDDDGGGNGNPENGEFNPTARGNFSADAGERLLGPFVLPDGQVFGMIAGTTDQDGSYITSPVTFSGNPPFVVFFPNGTTNEEGAIFVMPDLEFREQRKGTDQMMIVRRSTGSITVEQPEYN